MAAGRFDEAAALYAEIVRALPNEPGMRLNLGMALSMAGRPREAVPHLQAALKLRPDLLPASLFLGAAHMELGQPATGGRAPAEGSWPPSPTTARPGRCWPTRSCRSSATSRPPRHYRELSEQAPQDPQAWYGLGRSYEGLSRGAFETLQRSAPESAYLSAARRRGDGGPGASDKSAFPLYREALEKRPGLAEAHEALAQIYEQQRPPGLGRASSARRRRRFRRPTAGPRASSATSARDGTRRSSKPRGRCGRRRAGTGSPAPPASWPARRSPSRRRSPPRRRPARPGRGPARPEALPRRVEGGAEEGGRGLAGGPADPPRAGHLLFIAHEYARRPARSWRTC